jgi:hypothetical protein
MNQGERQTTEINSLRQTVGSLQLKLGVAHSTKDWLESELKRVSHQLIATTISKKKVDKKLFEMEQDTNEAKLYQMRDADKSDSCIMDTSSDKENENPKPKKFSRLASQKKILARHRRKTSLAVAAVKQGSSF